MEKREKVRVQSRTQGRKGRALFFVAFTGGKGKGRKRIATEISCSIRRGDIWSSCALKPDRLYPRHDAEGEKRGICRRLKSERAGRQTERDTAPPRGAGRKEKERRSCPFELKDEPTRAEGKKPALFPC